MRLRHCPFIFKTVQAAFDHSPFVLSITLHLFAVFLLTYDFSSENKSNVVSVPMFVVDLSQVKIAEMTNLPPKLAKTEVKKETKKSVRTSAYSKAVAKSAKPESRGGTKSGSAGKNPSSGAMLENDLGKLLDHVTSADKKKEPSPVPPANSIKNTGDLSVTDDPFKTLLASVDGIKSGMGYADDKTQAEVNADEIVTEGIEGGQGGSYMQELSVSEKDMIGIKLRECWNLDAGVRGVQNMLIEIRVFLDTEGTVKDVKILNKARYNKDTAYRSVAESARRAVYICDKRKEESPFRIFPENYKDSYDTWKTLLLRFNPFDGGVI